MGDATGYNHPKMAKELAETATINHLTV